MSLKFRISILHILVSFMSIFFVYMIYDSYIVTQKKDVKNQLNKIINLNKIYLQKVVKSIKQTLLSNKELSKDIHFEIHEKIKSNPNLNIQQLKNYILKKHNLENLPKDINISILDKNYKEDLTTSTEIIKNKLDNKTIEKLNKLKNIDQYIYIDKIHVNFLSQIAKSSSFSRLNDSQILKLEFILSDLKEEQKYLYDMLEIINSDLEFFYVIRYKDKQFYESIVQNRKKLIFNKQYLNKKEKFDIREQTDNYIIKVARNWENYELKSNDSLTLYSPILKKNNPVINIPGDIVMKLNLDITNENKFFQSIIFKLILFIFLHFILLFIIFFFTKKYQLVEEKLEKENNKHLDFVDYNKNFISNMVHQIRTPLSIILSNVSLIEILEKNNTSKYSSQINASINCLSNSYENLSYYISYKNLKYEKRKIYISDFIKERVLFFDEIAQANKKNILLNIKVNYTINFNDIELERLIDNNISNTLTNSDINSNIIINFYRENNKYNLEFIGYSKYFNIDNLFEKKEWTLIKDTSNISLGIYVIKEICIKNHIKYELKQENDYYIFRYHWS